ncbi:MAG: hypothetical protein RJB01_581 [Actinomycetota bacterium]
MRNAGRVIGVLILIVALVAGGFSLYVMSLIRAPFPQVAGSLEVSGINSEVRVLRDERGVPSIYADSLEDLFFTQGYVHAQDRFWEMDVRRHITAGELSEMFGASQVSTDAFIRTMGWKRIAEEELGLLNERSHRILDAYAAGVNEYLAHHSGKDLSLEYSVLQLQNPSYTPRPWEPADSVAWLKALAWDLRGNMSDEIYRAVMSASVGVDNTEMLFPAYPFEQHRPIITAGAVVGDTFDPEAQPSVSGNGAHAHFYSDEERSALLAVRQQASELENLLGPSGPGIGSNSWAVSGELTDTGKPLLANDPHLAPAMPSLWYQSGLYCTEQTPDCNYAVTGWTMAGLPGVFIGHNNSVAWGFTNLGPDVTDLVLHQTDGDTYLVDGVSQPMELRTEVIEVAGGDPVTITIRSTSDGPIISDIPDIPLYAQVGADAPVPAPGSAPGKAAEPDQGGDYAVALRWTALEAQPTFDAFDLLNTAQDFTQFREAARFLAVPAQNLLYADTAGTIAYQAPGRIPIRSNYSGKWPVPGWDSEYKWTGFVPFESLPYTVNPDENWIVTANQAVIGPNYEYFLTDDWAYGARSQRIVDLIDAATSGGAPLTAARMREMQMDNHNALAEFMVPRLKDVQFSDLSEGAQDALALMQNWDFQQGADSAGAAAFNAWWSQMVQRMFDAAAKSESITSSGNDRFWQVIMNIWDDPENFWWADRVTGVSGRDSTLSSTLNAAAEELSNSFGSDATAWRWGDMHTLTFTNQTLGTSGIAPIEMLFNRGPVAVSGGEATVNATGWTPADGFEVDWVPSMRQVIDLADFDASTWVNLTGNSGHAYNRDYSDQIDGWLTGEQFPWPYSPEAVLDGTRNTLTLLPK